MTRFHTLKASACAAALLSAPAAFADVTAEQVWADWKSNLEVYGSDGVTIGDEAVTSGAVTVSGIAVTMDDGLTKVTAELGEVTFAENGDGTVTVTMSDTVPLMLTDSEGVSVKMSVSQSGMSMVVSGDPAAMTYAVSADQYGFKVDEISENGTVVPSDIRVTLNGLDGTYTSEAGDPRALSYDFATASVDLLVDVTPPEDQGKVLMSGKINGLAASANVSIPEGANFEEPDALFAAGFGMQGGYSYDDATYIFDVTDGGSAMNGTVSTGAATIAAQIDSGQVTYDVNATSIAMNATSSDLPFPLDVTLAEYGIGFAMPLAKSDEPTDFGLRLNLTDLKISDELWGMVPPLATLPNEPATLKFDLAGTAKLFFDLTDPAQADAMAMADVPGELHTLSLNGLEVRAVGAEVTGEGDFTFDNADMETFPGFPRPMGDVTININGANALIDKLVSIGLVPEDQAMMGRMMIGMFAQTVGEDQLTSKIEVDATGAVLANGQRIR